MLFFSATQCGLKQIYLLVEYTMSLFACCFFVVVVVVFYYFDQDVSGWGWGMSASGVPSLSLIQCCVP